MREEQRAEGLPSVRPEEAVQLGMDLEEEELGDVIWISLLR